MAEGASHTLRPCPLCRKAPKQSELISSQPQHWVALRLSFAVFLHGAQSSASEKCRKRQEEGKHASLMSQHPKNNTSERFPISHRLKTSQFQSPKFLITGWHTATSHIVIPLLVLTNYSAVGGRKWSLCPPSCSPSWAELLAFTLHRRLPCASKTHSRIKPGIDEYAGIFSAPHSCCDSVPLYRLPARK